MESHPVLGWPIVTASDCFSVVRNAGIRAWPKLNNPVPVDDFLKVADANQVDSYNRFAPKTCVAQFRNPFDNSVFHGFRVVFKPYSLVILFVDGYIAITAEWKHGNDRITFVPVCGVAGKEEAGLTTLPEKMLATAIRECREETGLEIEKITPLSGSEGIYYSVRNSLTQCFPYLAYAKTFTRRGQTKFDNTEHLIMVLFSVEEWLKLLEDNSLFEANPDFGIEDCSRASTYAALRFMGRLVLV